MTGAEGAWLPLTAGLADRVARAQALRSEDVYFGARQVTLGDESEGSS